MFSKNPKPKVTSLSMPATPTAVIFETADGGSISEPTPNYATKYPENIVFEKNGIVNKNGNCFLIETAKNKKGWLKAVKWIIDNPDCLQWAGENLYKFTKENYSLENVTKKRAQIYTELIENKEKYIK